MARKLIRELRVTQNDITRICSTSDLRTTANERQPYTFTTTSHVSWTRGISTSACRVRQFFFNDTNMFMLLVRWTATRRRDENKL